MLRDLRRIAEGAKADLREGLGPEFQDFDFEDLNPRRFVQKHLLDDMTDVTRPLMDEFNGTGAVGGSTAATGTAGQAARRRGTALRRRGHLSGPRQPERPAEPREPPAEPPRAARSGGPYR